MDEYRKDNFPDSMEACRKIQLAWRRLSYFQGEIKIYSMTIKHSKDIQIDRPL